MKNNYILILLWFRYCYWGWNQFTQAGQPCCKPLHSCSSLRVHPIHYARSDLYDCKNDYSSSYPNDSDLVFIREEMKDVPFKLFFVCDVCNKIIMGGSIRSAETKMKGNRESARTQVMREKRHKLDQDHRYSWCKITCVLKTLTFCRFAVFCVINGPMQPFARSIDLGCEPEKYKNAKYGLLLQ